MADDATLGLGATLPEPDAAPGPTTPATKPAIELTMRSTVLPRLMASGAHRTSVPDNTPRFAPVRLLGRGGIGEVTLARDNDIDRPVALKRLRSEAQSEESMYRFVHEIRTVGQLEHPNIPPIHDVGIDDHGQHYFVMRYIEGDTLETIIAKLAAGDPAYHRRFTFEHRVQIFLGVLHAVNYAHSKDIIHRDIKPANIMVGPFGEVVVMDWGIAKKTSVARGSSEALALAATLDPASGAAGSTAKTGKDPLFQTRHGSLVGTPAYMSPEQASGRTDDIDARSDIYSLSVVLYELLALQHYLPGRKTVQEMLASVQKDKQPDAHHVQSPHQSQVPAELSWFIERGLKKDPKARYPSVAAMIDELQIVLAGGFAVQCYVTFLKRIGTIGVRFVDRHPRIALALASSFVVVALAAIIGFVVLLVAK